MIQWAVWRRLRTAFRHEDIIAVQCMALLWLPSITLVLLTLNFSSSVIGRDFSTFWMAGHAGDNPYGLLAEFVRERGRPSPVIYNFTYPPPVLFLTKLVAELPLTFAFLAWNCAGAILFYVAAKPYCPKGFPAVLAVITPAAVVNDNFGQMGFLVGALWLFAWRGSNLCAAALAIKPQIGFLVLVKLVRDRRLTGATAWGLAFVAISTIAFGLNIWSDFIRHIIAFQESYVAKSPIVAWLFQSTTPYVGYGLFGWICFASAGNLLLARNFNVWTAATATFLISPYGFHYDMTVVCLGFGIFCFESWDELAWYEKVLVGLAFAVPALVHFGTWFASPILLGGLWVQSRVRPSRGAFGSTKTLAEAQ